MDYLDSPLSFQGELWCRTGNLNRKVYLLLDTTAGQLRQYTNRSDYMDDLPVEFQFNLNVIYSIRRNSIEKETFTIRTKDRLLTYYCDFPDMTLEWFSKIQLSLEYYHISYEDKSSRGSKKLDEEIKTFISDKSEKSEETTSNGERFVNEESFETIEEIGSGGFGNVLKVIKKDTGATYAMKKLNKNSLRNKRMIKYAWSECKTLKALNHPFIIPLEWSFQTHSHIYLVMEYCPFGDFEPILDHYKKLSEQVAKFYICETILAIEYLHSKSIVYRDLKPSNLLLDKDGHIKLADFSLAKENATVENPAISFCGTPAYLPPEILSNAGAYTATDVYLIGVNLFKFLTGNTPFYDRFSSLPDLYRAISNARLVFPKDVREDAKNLITAMMNKVPEKRPSIQKVKEHRFFSDVNWENVYKKSMSPPITVEELTNVVNRVCGMENSTYMSII